MKTVWIINHYAIPPSLGGLNRHYYFAQNLIKKGYKVRIFTSSAIHNTDINIIKDSKKFKERVMDGVEYTYLKTCDYQSNGFSRIKNMLGFCRQVKKISKNFNEHVDVIYTSAPHIFAARSAQKLAKKLHVPNIVEIRDLWPLSIVEYKGISNNNPIIRCLYHLEKKIYKKADALIFTMPGGKEYIKDKKWTKSIDLNKIYNLNNGIDFKIQEQQLKEYKLDTAVLTNDTFKIVYTGSIRAVNNVGLIVETAKILNNDNMSFIIYGDGTEKQQLEDKCKNEGITNVHFMGRVEKKYVPYICSMADLNVILVKDSGVSKYGVSWNKLFEYMYAGKPIVSSVSVNYDFIENYQCGTSIKQQSPEEMAKAIAYYYELDKSNYEQICQNARSAAADFDYEKLTEKLEIIIEETVKKV